MSLVMAPVSWRTLRTALRGGGLARTGGHYTGRGGRAQARGGPRASGHEDL